jgi:putative membrane protein
LLVLFVAGIFAGGSMIVPGISGSFVMVLLGQYHTVIRAIRHHDILRIGAVGLGALVGVWAFAKIISVLLDRYPRRTFFFILGLVVASLVPIFPGIPSGAIPALAAAVVTVVGFGVSYALGRVRK